MQSRGNDGANRAVYKTEERQGAMNGLSSAALGDRATQGGTGAADGGVSYLDTRGPPVDANPADIGSRRAPAQRPCSCSFSLTFHRRPQD
jgi:hypothetical protein